MWLISDLLQYLSKFETPSNIGSLTDRELEGECMKQLLKQPWICVFLLSSYPKLLALMKG